MKCKRVSITLPPSPPPHNTYISLWTPSNSSLVYSEDHQGQSFASILGYTGPRFDYQSLILRMRLQPAMHPTFPNPLPLTSPPPLGLSPLPPQASYTLSKFLTGHFLAGLVRPPRTHLYQCSSASKAESNRASVLLAQLQYTDSCRCSSARNKYL
jgi:hypothetical protein